MRDTSADTKPVFGVGVEWKSENRPTIIYLHILTIVGREEVVSQLWGPGVLANTSLTGSSVLCWSELSELSNPFDTKQNNKHTHTQL